jgi:2-amino-4-hydroxy-6-hydroxymethyldihydropteridine diphosphokinase
MGTRVFVGLGSNLGDREAHLRHALDELARAPGVRVTRRSSAIETAPVGGPRGQGPYLNAVVELDTDLAPRALLELLLAIEQRAGRQRRERNGPRTLDLDLLLYGDQRIEAQDLRVPHPRLEERAFVLQPLSELEPDLELPFSRRRVSERLRDLLAHRM